MKSRSSSIPKKILKAVLAVILIAVLVVGGYVAYVFISYHRLPDEQVLDIRSNAPSSALDVSGDYHLTSWNIGFGAYTADFSFFMDGGIYSRAYSEEFNRENIQKIIDELKSYNSDFYLIQEVDFDSTRTYHVDQREMIYADFDHAYTSTFGVNYDSPYLFYPISEPIGASKSGLLTLSGTKITESIRRSLPIQDGFAKFLDLDRAFTVNRIPTSDGKELVLINLHLSAYTTDDTIVTRQLEMLSGVITEEYQKGNYVIAGGDFNMDLLQDSGSIFGVSGEDFSWAQPFPLSTVPEGVTLVAPYDEANPVPSCRNADSPWNPETNFQITIDGFLVTDNVKVESCEVTDQQFAYSDHQPVQLKFTLLSE